VLLLSLISIRCSAVERGNDSTSISGFLATDLTIWSGDGAQVIGHARYRIFAGDSAEVLRGESTYFNGERDIEVEHLKRVPNRPPTLISYKHSFFNPDLSYQRVNSLDVTTGVGSCQIYVHHQLEDRRFRFTAPDDTYAGASIVVFVVFQLRQRVEHIEFHSFNCLPGPKIIATEASMESGRRVKWSMYPGDLITMEMRPDFGWADFLIRPFVGKMYAWFDPDDNWNYVGGIYDRFYGGSHILTVLAAQPHKPINDP
jgi:hypothetical protein